MSTFSLSRSAELDLDEIDLRTIELFGFAQADKTDAAFYKAFHELGAMPRMGHRRSDLDPPGREFLCWTVLRRFLIVYEPTKGGIRVARIIDGSRDLRSVLTEDEGDADRPA